MFVWTRQWPQQLTCRYGVHAYTKSVVSSIALVTEHHLVLVVGLLAYGAGFAFHALPAIRLDHGHQLRAHVQAGWVTYSLRMWVKECRSREAADTHGQINEQGVIWHNQTSNRDRLIDMQMWEKLYTGLTLSNIMIINIGIKFTFPDNILKSLIII